MNGKDMTDLAEMVKTICYSFGGATFVLVALATFLGQFITRRDISVLKADFLKYEAYNSISKEEYQKLFKRKILLYEQLLSCRNEISKNRIENAFNYEFHQAHFRYYQYAAEKIVYLYKDSALLMSEQLAKCSAEIANISDSILERSNISEGNAYMQTGGEVNQHTVDAEEIVLEEYSNLYENLNKWDKQLEVDVANIRKVLDLSGKFLKND